MLDGGSNPRQQQRLSSHQKKFVTFAIEMDSPFFSLIPLFPVTTAVLMEFATWCSDNGINGWDSISTYVGAVVAWGIETSNQLDPRHATPQDERAWKKFVRNFPKVIGGPPPKVKLRLQPGHLEAIFLDFVPGSWLDRQDRTVYLLLWYASCRIGHVAPDSSTVAALHHALRWCRLRFVPDLINPVFVYLYFPSTKTRPMMANRPWFTSVGRVSNDSFCLVSQLQRHFIENYRGDPNGLVFTRSESDPRHLTRTSFTNFLRFRLAAAARHLGITIDPSAWSGISFRKGSLQTGADMGIPGFALAEMADHSSVDMTRINYLGDNVATRARRTALIGGGFHGVTPLDRLRPAPDLVEPPATQRRFR